MFLRACELCRENDFHSQRLIVWMPAMQPPLSGIALEDCQGNGEIDDR